MELRLASDTLLLVDFGQRIDPAVNARAIGLAQALAAANVPGVRDVVPAYCSVGVHFDPLLVDLPALEARISAEGQRITNSGAETSGATIEIPVHYGGAEGPDLALLAEHAGLSPDEVVRLHTGRAYRVYMLGFVPGFAYMGGVDPRIAAPRHRVPRERVLPGSVGIAGEQTGVYPIETPGGWQIIGRTAVRVFDAAREPACLLAPGDLVRFVAVDAGGRV